MMLGHYSLSLTVVVRVQEIGEIIRFCLDLRKCNYPKLVLERNKENVGLQVIRLS